MYRIWLRENKLSYAKYFSILAIVFMAMLVPFDFLLFKDGFTYSRIRILVIIVLTFNLYGLSVWKIKDFDRLGNGIYPILILPGLLFIGVYLYWLAMVPPPAHGTVFIANLMSIFFITFFYNRFWKEQYVLNLIIAFALLCISLYDRSLNDEVLLLLICELASTLAAFFFRREFVGTLYVKDLIRLNKELRLAKEAAEQSEKVKTLFLANMSHEIRTPLNSIMGYIQLVRKEMKSDINPDVKYFFSIIEKSGDRLMNTVHEILDISQIEAGTFHIKPVRLDLTNLVEEIYREHRIFAEEKNLKYLLNIPKEPVWIVADRYSIYQAIHNLVGNAIKYTKSGSVDLSLILQRSRVKVEIRDTGIGMGKEYLEKVFDVFSQESQGYTKKYQGIGLGLSLAKRYIDLNKGKINVDSKKDFGTTFTLEFEINYLKE